MPGQVYDLDFIANLGWVQVLVRGPSPTPALVTRDAAAASLLGALYVSGRLCDLLPHGGGGMPPEIARVLALPLPPTPIPPHVPPPGSWAVRAFEFDVVQRRLDVEFVGPTGFVRGWDSTGLVRSIIESAVAANESVQYLDIDPNGRIVRVKVNH